MVPASTELMRAVKASKPLPYSQILPTQRSKSSCKEARAVSTAPLVSSTMVKVLSVQERGSAGAGTVIMEMDLCPQLDPFR